MKAKTRHLFECFVLIFSLLNYVCCDSEPIGRDFQTHDHGFEISAPAPTTNSYPFRYFAGIRLGDIDYYIKQNPTAILPTHQDTHGNWGKQAGFFQLSLRFGRQEYFKGQPVFGLVILRNLSWTNTWFWWRNALPDNGYQFIVHHGNKTYKWRREKNPPPKMEDGHDGAVNSDPYYSRIAAHSQELTVIDFAQFFDLSQTGEYTIQAQVEVPSSDNKGTTNVVSDVAKFTVINEASKQ